MLPYYENQDVALEVFFMPNETFPAHLHNSIEMAYILDGYVDITIQGYTKRASKGDLAVIFPELVHSYQLLPDTAAHSIIIIAKPIMSGDFLNQIKKYYPKNPLIRAGQIHPDIIYAIERLYLDRDESPNPAISRALIQLILGRCLSFFSLKEKEGMDVSGITYRLISYISGHFKEPITLTSLAKELGVSKYYLSHIFSNTMEMNFNQYLNYIRLDYAANLITHTDQSLTRICEESGFESQRTFNRVFKEYFQMNPREYRFSRHHKPSKEVTFCGTKFP